MFTTGFTMIRLSQNHDGIIFALVTACDPGAITTRARIVNADGGNALTPASLVLNEILPATMERCPTGDFSLHTIDEV